MVTEDTAFPPRRTRETLIEWVSDFQTQTDVGDAEIIVAQQEGDATRDTGLVVVRPRSNSAMAVYMQPRGFDEPLWEVTLPAREDEVPMSALQLSSLGTFVSLAATLCTYLQWRSLEWDRASGRHDA